MNQEPSGGDLGQHAGGKARKARNNSEHEYAPHCRLLMHLLSIAQDKSPFYDPFNRRWCQSSFEPQNGIAQEPVEPLFLVGFREHPHRCLLSLNVAQVPDRRCLQGPSERAFRWGRKTTRFTRLPRSRVGGAVDKQTGTPRLLGRLSGFQRNGRADLAGRARERSNGHSGTTPDQSPGRDRDTGSATPRGAKAPNPRQLGISSNSCTEP
jgi:hypothetical protein